MNKKFLCLTANFVLSGTLQAAALQVNTPEGTARALFSAWKNNNRSEASKVALPAAVRWIFRQDRTTEYDFENCDRQASTWHCFYRDENGGAMNMTMIKTGQIYKVKSISYYLD